MSSSLKSKVPAGLAMAMLVSACTSAGPTETDFGNSVRNFISHQQIESTGPLREDQPIESSDGRRLEKVTTIYQTYVGDPLPVTKDVQVDAGGQK